MNVREANFGIESSSGRRAVDAGPNAVGFAQCFEFLRQAQVSTQRPFARAPTRYYCLRTSDGRIARFRVASSKVQYLPERMVNVSVLVEYTAWDVAQ